MGIAWQVRGAWQADGEGAPILTGDGVPPGALLQPSRGTTNGSITVFLPDGQRVLYECFTAGDCARGFRVPSLFRRPTPFALDMLARLHAVLIRGDRGSQTRVRNESRLPRDEVIAELGPGDQVHIAGLAAKLPDGHYTYDLRPLDRAYPRRSHLVFEKSGPSIAIALPSAGLYVLTIIDDLNTPRIDLFIAAIQPAQTASFTKSFHDACALMKDWNVDYEGWPIHEFQRAYLESLVLGLGPPNAGASIGSDHAVLPRTGVTAEPAFSPRPGQLGGDTAVALRCSTPGATMHFTVDGSQPVNSSPVYRAPIMVRGTELTIKAFASAAGEKDSPVVTGIFLIQSPD